MNFTRACAEAQPAQTKGVAGPGVSPACPLLIPHMHAGSPQRGSPPSRATPGRRQPSRAMSDSPRLPHTPAEFSGRSSAATFTSCLDIAVEGAIPIDQLESVAAPGKKDSAKPAGTESKRAPRKSKTDALAALTAAASQEESTDRALSDEAGARVLLRDGPPIPVSPLLDLSSVKTPNPRNAPSRPKERPFGLTDCPTFRPTPEQFKDPMAYIKSISENAKSYGMCKIIPPLGWAMPFVTDTEVRRARLLICIQCAYSVAPHSSDVPFQDAAPTPELH